MPRRTFQSGSYLQKQAEGYYSTVKRYRRSPRGGIQEYHPAAIPPRLDDVIKALRNAETTTVSIRVLGTLRQTPDDYDPDEYAPGKMVYLGKVKVRTRTLARAIAYYTNMASTTNPRYAAGYSTALLDYLSDATGFQWDTVATVYITER